MWAQQPALDANGAAACLEPRNLSSCRTHGVWLDACYVPGKSDESFAAKSWLCWCLPGKITAYPCARLLGACEAGAGGSRSCSSALAWRCFKHGSESENTAQQQRPMRWDLPPWIRFAPFRQGRKSSSNLRGQNEELTQELRNSEQLLADFPILGDGAGTTARLLNQCCKPPKGKPKTTAMEALFHPFTQARARIRVARSGLLGSQS